MVPMVDLGLPATWGAQGVGLVGEDLAPTHHAPPPCPQHTTTPAVQYAAHRHGLHASRPPTLWLQAGHLGRPLAWCSQLKGGSPALCELSIGWHISAHTEPNDMGPSPMPLVRESASSRYGVRHWNSIVRHVTKETVLPTSCAKVGNPHISSSKLMGRNESSHRVLSGMSRFKTGKWADLELWAHKGWPPCIRPLPYLCNHCDPGHHFWTSSLRMV